MSETLASPAIVYLSTNLIMCIMESPITSIHCLSGFSRGRGGLVRLENHFAVRRGDLRLGQKTGCLPSSLQNIDKLSNEPILLLTLIGLLSDL